MFDINSLIETNKKQYKRYCYLTRESYIDGVLTKSFIDTVGETELVQLLLLVIYYYQVKEKLQEKIFVDEFYHNWNFKIVKLEKEIDVHIETGVGISDVDTGIGVGVSGERIQVPGFINFKTSYLPIFQEYKTGNKFISYYEVKENLDNVRNRYKNNFNKMIRKINGHRLSYKLPMYDIFDIMHTGKVILRTHELIRETLDDLYVKIYGQKDIRDDISLIVYRSVLNSNDLIRKKLVILDELGNEIIPINNQSRWGLIMEYLGDPNYRETLLSIQNYLKPLHLRKSSIGIETYELGVYTLYDLLGF